MHSRLKMIVAAIAVVAGTSLVAVAPAQLGSLIKKEAGAVAGLNVVETAAANGKFTTLITAAQAAGLAETLSTKGPITVFAPTDEAFKKLPKETLAELLTPAGKEKLKAILLYHVVEGSVPAAEAKKLTEATTLNGAKLAIKVDGGNVKINDATVTSADIKAKNGIIHAIDTVLLPPATEAAAAGEKSIVSTAVAAGEFKTLATALKAAGLTDTLEGEGPFTVFAPTDAAFKKLPPATLAKLLTPAGKEDLKKILLSHVVVGRVEAKDVVALTSVKTVSGQEFPIVAADGGVTIKGAKVVKTDIDAGNGLIHVIDTVLIPE